MTLESVQHSTGVVLALFSHWTAPLAYETGTAHGTGENRRSEDRGREFRNSVSSFLFIDSFWLFYAVAAATRSPSVTPLGDIFNKVSIINTQPFYAFDYSHLPDMKLET